MIADEMGLSAPVYVEDKRDFTLIDDAFDQDDRTGFLRDYMSSHKNFDATNTTSALGRNTCTADLSAEKLRPYIRWYVSLLQSRRKQALTTAAV